MSGVAMHNLVQLSSAQVESLGDSAEKPKKRVKAAREGSESTVLCSEFFKPSFTILGTVVQGGQSS